ncbi:tetratricopeptide repeat protein [Dapis sp. BLCC M229]|uniref:tetratricopeptide repeat protein n=1 Tax=Dapis sp. BLCC M229 TaxID=3400188 RepID=UPI003CF855B1
MNAGQLLKQANRLKREGRLDEAIALYHQVIDINPNFAWAYNNLGDAFVKQGKLDEGVVEYRRAIEINPNSAWFNYQLGKTLIQLSSFRNAILYFKNAVAINPKIYNLCLIFDYILNQNKKALDDVLLTNKISQNNYVIQSNTYYFDTNKNYLKLTETPEWITVLLKPKSIYSLTVEAFSEVATSDKSLIEFELFDKDNEEIPYIKSLKLGVASRSIKTQEKKFSKYRVNLLTPPKIKYAKIGFRGLYSELPIILKNQIKLEPVQSNSSLKHLVEPNSSLKYLIVATARSGTKFMSEALKSIGVRCGHEAFFGLLSSKQPKLTRADVENRMKLYTQFEADSSWLAVPFLGTDIIPSNTKIVHLTRHPENVCESLIAFGFFNRKDNCYTNYLLQHIPEIKASDPEIVKCCKWYLHWHQKIQRRYEQEVIHHKIEDGVTVLFEKLNLSFHKYKIFDETNCNTRNPNNRRCVRLLSELKEADLLNQLVEISEIYGYSLS